MSPMNVVLWLSEQEKPVDEVSYVFFSVRHATERSIQCELHDFSKIIFWLCDILEEKEHD